MTTLEVDGREVEVARPDKVLFADDGITKLDLAEYYERVADVMVPHIQRHPLALVRFPDGLDGERFFQKAAPDSFPDWIDRVRLEKREGGATEYVLCCDDAATLVYLANLACVEIHALLARAERPKRPDRMVFDLDPSTGDFEPVREGARALRKALADVGSEPLLMTTGSRGLHVYVPLPEEDGFDDVRRHARDVAEDLVGDHDFLTLEHRKEKRGDRVFVDVLRNAYGAHTVSPYSVRGRPGAPVATPLDWDELDDPELHPQRYTIRNLFRRLGQKDDPWAGIWASRRR